MRIIVLLIYSSLLFGESLPGTQELRDQGDLAAAMLAGMDQFVNRALDESIGKRQQHWQQDFSSPVAYEKSIVENRKRLATIVGAVDPRVNPHVELIATPSQSSVVAESQRVTIQAVRWDVLAGVTAEGLLVTPKGRISARIVAIPDAADSPESIVNSWALRLAESGCQLLIPVLIDRQAKWSGTERFGFTKQPHREFVWRMAFELGRHPIGLEVEKVQSAVDWFEKQTPALPIGVAGHGEGGLIALYTAALDRRIHATLVSGYFESRQEVWKEPLYRNVWSLLKEFGDAEIAGLIAPRALVVEAAQGPEDAGPPEVPITKRGDTPGQLRTPPLAAVQAEVERAKPTFAKLNVVDQLALAVSGGGAGSSGSDAALQSFLSRLSKGKLAMRGASPSVRESANAEERMHRQFLELVEYLQRLSHNSSFAREAFWSKADATSVETWEKSLPYYRKYFHDEVIGHIENSYLPVPAQTRKVKEYDRERWVGYEVKIPVWKDVFAYGLLLLPKDLKPGERRPVVVCQHGNEGRPQTTVDPEPKFRRPWAAELADQGFIVYLPQNPYIFQETFRRVNRKSNALQWSLFSYIVGQHERMLEWLAQQPFVDPERIGYYGISYGGKTAVRVPPLLSRYCLVITAADFGEYVGKMVGLDQKTSFMYTQEYEMYEWNMANTFGYSDLASMLIPKPFMVERGHFDTVGLDEWVAFEYAKVYRRYDLLGLKDRTEIEYFIGPHTINGEGTYRFLHKHLRWPQRSVPIR